MDFKEITEAYGGDLGEKKQFYNSKTHRGRMCFWNESKRVDTKIMDENSIRDDVTKNNCEKNVDQNQFRENNSS